jgi:hypothetical protein
LFNSISIANIPSPQPSPARGEGAKTVANIEVYGYGRNPFRNLKI